MGFVCDDDNRHLLAYSRHDIEMVKRLLSFLIDPPVRKAFGERRYVGPALTSNLHRMWLWNGENADEVP